VRGSAAAKGHRSLSSDVGESAKAGTVLRSTGEVLTLEA
jgi:hypothetical protein